VASKPPSQESLVTGADGIKEGREARAEEAFEKAHEALTRAREAAIEVIACVQGLRTGQALLPEGIVRLLLTKLIQEVEKQTEGLQEAVQSFQEAFQGSETERPEAEEQEEVGNDCFCEGCIKARAEAN
jgi:hypothetical protein